MIGKSILCNELKLFGIKLKKKNILEVVDHFCDIKLLLDESNTIFLNFCILKNILNIGMQKLAIF